MTEAMSAPETGDRHRPGAADIVHRAGRAGATACVPTACSRARSSGIRMGEAAAAVVAGALSLEDGVRVICRRSRLLRRLAGGGAMASVELTAPAGARRTGCGRAISDVVVSVVASPESTVVGGATDRRFASWSPAGKPRGAWPARWRSTWPPTPLRSTRSWWTWPMSWQNSRSEERRRCRSTRPPSKTRGAAPAFDAPLLGRQSAAAGPFAGGGPGGARRRSTGCSARLSPHPLLMRGVEQTAQAGEVSRSRPSRHAAATGPQPHGLRDFVADLHSAGAAVDFSVLYPDGRLVDAPLPTWTHRQLPDRLR